MAMAINLTKLIAQTAMFFLVVIFALIKPPKSLYRKWKEAIAPCNSPELHARKVARVQEQVFEWIRNGKKTKLCTARPWWQSISARVTSHKVGKTGISMAELDDIIEVDERKRVVKVEPLADMGKLSKRLIKSGWMIPVIPEFKWLTVGGLINGAGLETSSHKYGLFCHTCVEFEIVLADGRIVNCSKDENSDLFHSIPMSHGTIGFLTSATIKIIPAKTYVRLEYIPVHSLDAIVSEFSKQTLRPDGNEFVEGFMFGLNKGVIMVGNMTYFMEADGQVNSIGRWYKPWFHTHAKTFLEKSSSAKNVEYIPLRDYIHRHDRTLFWSMDLAIPYGQHPIFRYLFGWILPINPLFMKAFVGPIEFLLGKNIITYFVSSVKSTAVVKPFLQDYVVPIETLKELLLLAHNEIEVYPIWLCPQVDKNWPGMINYDGRMLVDVGLYGESSTTNSTIASAIKTFERFCLANGGFYGTYADTYLTREEFKKMFNHDLYFKVRKEYGCSDVFPEIYDKIATN